MTLRARLATALLTIACILVIPLVMAVVSLNTLHRDAVALQNGEFAASLLLGRLREGLARAASRANSEPPSKRSATSCAGRMLTRATPSRTEC